MTGLRRVTAVVVLVAFSGCAGWTFGPSAPWGGATGPVGAPVSVPSVDEGQRFDLFVIGIALFGISALLVQLPVGGAMDDWVYAVPLAGPYIQWEQTATCPEGTSCFGMAINVLGILVTAAEVTGLALFFWSLFSDSE
jgi:hypothetical protein